MLKRSGHADERHAAERPASTAPAFACVESRDMRVVVCGSQSEGDTAEMRTTTAQRPNGMVHIR